MLKALKQSVKAVLRAVQRKRRAAQLEREVPHVQRAQLAADLRQLGIAQGDALFIHSSLKSLGFVEGGPAAVIGALQDAVGPQGTLVLPTYYMPGGTIQATCEMADYVFDARRHGTHMGALPEAFLATGGVQRSIHPTHSVSAWGRHAAAVTADHHRAPSVFGVGSPWERFLNLPQAKVLGLGISMGPVTFYHLAEDLMGDAFPVPVWTEQVYQMPCIDHQGRTCQVPVRAFDPQVSARRIDHKPRADLREYFAREFDAAGLRHTAPVAQTTAWTIEARAFFDHLVHLAGQGITIYSTAEQLAARPIALHNTAPST